MAATFRPCRGSSRIITSSPRLPPVPLPPATGRSFGGDCAAAPPGSPRRLRRRDGAGENSAPTNGEDSTPAYSHVGRDALDAGGTGAARGLEGRRAQPEGDRGPARPGGLDGQPRAAAE